MKEKAFTIINYILLALSFFFGFYLAGGIYVIGNDPERLLVLWELLLASGLFLTFFISLIVINIIRGKYKPSKTILFFVSGLFLINLISILVFKDYGNYQYIGINGELCDFEYRITSFMRFSFIMQSLAFFSMGLLIFDITNQIVERKTFIKFASLIALGVVGVLMIISYFKEASCYVNLITHIGKDDMYTYSVTSVFENKNNYAYVLTIALFASIYLHNQNKKWYWLAISSFIFVNVIYTMSKFLIVLDFILILAYLLYRFIVSYKDNRKRNLIALTSVCGTILLFTVALLIVIGITGNICSFFSALFSTKGYDTIETRTWIWQKAVFVINKANWFTGVGYNLFGQLLFNYNINDWETRAINDTRCAHNGFIQSIGDGGIVLLIAVIIVIGMLIYLCIKNYKKDRDLAVISLLFITFSIIYMILESGSIFFAHSIEYGAASIMIITPLLCLNKEQKEREN